MECYMRYEQQVWFKRATNRVLISAIRSATVMLSETGTRCVGRLELSGKFTVSFMLENGAFGAQRQPCVPMCGQQAQFQIAVASIL